jgi:23S rRNA (uracil1939-C5)-methyltransferase
VKKNDIFEVEIIDMTMDGEGIGKVDGFPLFIKDTIIGDVIRGNVTKIKKTYGYGRLQEILRPSAYRVEPKCPIARQCGGCQIQAMDYKRQLVFKQEKIANNLARIGGITGYEMEPVMGMEVPYGYRNKAQYPVRMGRDGKIAIGFYAGRTHSVIETEECFINHPVNVEIVKRVRAYLERYHIAPYDEETHTGLVRHILTRVGFVTGQIMVCLVINGRKLPAAQALVDSLCEIEGMTSISFNINTAKTNVILGNEVVNLYGDGFITDYIGDVQFQISPLSFYQVNPVQTKRLYEKALSYAGLTGTETVWDMYCGIGTISLFLAQKAKHVYGVEVVPQAIEDARRNASLNHMDNVTFFVGKAEEVVPEFYAKHQSENGAHPDVVVVDPPRKGCDGALLATIAAMAPERVVYVSCDSATLARDLKWMCQNGYQVEKVCGCDMFGHSGHVETVVLLSRKFQ